MPLRRLGLAVLCAAGSALAGGDWAAADRATADQSAWFPPTLNREGGTLEVTFGMDEAAPVSLLAFDARGRALTTLLEGEQPAGYHHLSVFSNRLQGTDAGAYFQLRAGGRILAETRPRTL
jgi:hypothetical protein